MRCLAQGHLDTQLGGARVRTSNLAVPSQPALPPELHAALFYHQPSYFQCLSKDTSLEGILSVINQKEHIDRPNWYNS